MAMAIKDKQLAMVTIVFHGRNYVAIYEVIDSVRN